MSFNSRYFVLVRTVLEIWNPTPNWLNLGKECSSMQPVVCLKELGKHCVTTFMLCKITAAKKTIFFLTPVFFLIHRTQRLRGLIDLIDLIDLLLKIFHSNTK